MVAKDIASMIAKVFIKRVNIIVFQISITYNREIFLLEKQNYFRFINKCPIKNTINQRNVLSFTVLFSTNDKCSLN